jgi:hypothetical protein
MIFGPPAPRVRPATPSVAASAPERVDAPSPAPAPTTPPAPADQQPYLQDRTPDQLKTGMVVAVVGAGSDDLAAARLVQDGAEFIASAAGSPLGLVQVSINDGGVDRQGALGMATFYGNKGWFGLSQRSTKDVLAGITHLRATPWDQWSEAERQGFLQANEVILHESGHVTLPAYDSANIHAFQDSPQSFEEGLTEITTMTHIAPFMKQEYGITLSDLTNRISQSTSAYTRFTERLTRMLNMGGDGSPEQLAAAASLVADGTRADQRANVIAQRIGTNLGGPNAPKPLIDQIAKNLEGFVAEDSGTRTQLMQIQAALVDFKAGKPVNVDAVVAQVQAENARHPHPMGPVVGTEPLA